MSIWTLHLFLSLAYIFLGVAFITLLERKILGLSQVRLGPNKVMFWGLGQPVLDGLKLLAKEQMAPSGAFLLFFVGGPMLGLLVMLLLWGALPGEGSTASFFFSLLFVLCGIGLMVYASLVSGWGSHSKYGLLGAIRACSQSVAYEVALSFFLLSFIFLFSSLSLMSSGGWMAGGLWPAMGGIFFAPWFLSCVAECNRAPFDFSEGESELISGFNVEFGSNWFVFIFLSEYGMILFFSFLSGVLLSPIFILFVLGGILLIRSVFPRFRYDKLMSLAWCVFLPIGAIGFLLMSGLLV